MSLTGVHLLLIDAPNLIRRIHAAVPANDPAEKIEQTVSSSTRSLRRALERHAPTHAMCAFDCNGPTWRHERYPDYKKGRPAIPAELAEIYRRCRQAFEQTGVRCLEQPAMEADDLIASFATRAAELGGHVTILSTDTGQAQLLDARIDQYDHFRERPVTADTIRNRFAVEPTQLIDYHALVGDASHSLPGIPGIGAKTAARLLSEHASLEDIIAHASDIGGRTGDNIALHADTARMTRQLVQLRRDIRIEQPLKNFRYRPAS